MKSLKLNLVAISGLVMITGCSTGTPGRNIAAQHSDTTPYDSLKTKLQISSGQTYLSFMQHKVKPGLDAFEDAIKGEEQKFPNQYSKWQTDLIAEGDGVAVRIDSKNYFFNVGYLNGSAAERTTLKAEEVTVSVRRIASLTRATSST